MFDMIRSHSKLTSFKAYLGADDNSASREEKRKPLRSKAKK
ncbi:MAG: hypothetical protein V3V02_02750 [Rhizobiaceae bacterium]